MAKYKLQCWLDTISKKLLTNSLSNIFPLSTTTNKNLLFWILSSKNILRDYCNLYLNCLYAHRSLMSDDARVRRYT